MSSEFPCPVCGWHIPTVGKSSGQPVQCDKCKAAVVVPGTRAADKALARLRRRSRLVWAVAVVLLLLGGATGGFYLYDRQTRWHTHESAEGGFRIDLPAAPRDDLPELIGVERSPARGLEGTVLPNRFEEYTVAHVSIRPSHAHVPVRPVAGIRPYPTDPSERSTVASGYYLDQTLRFLVQTPGVKRVTLGDRTTVGEHPAMDAELELTSGGVGLARVVVSRSREYVLIACGPRTEDGMKRYRRFIDSFVVTDPDR